MTVEIVIFGNIYVSSEDVLFLSRILNRKPESTMFDISSDSMSAARIQEFAIAMFDKRVQPSLLKRLLAEAKSMSPAGTVDTSPSTIANWGSVLMTMGRAFGNNIPDEAMILMYISFQARSIPFMDSLCEGPDFLELLKGCV